MMGLPRKLSKPHVIDSKEITGHVQKAEYEVAAATIESRVGAITTTDGKPRDFSMIDPGSLRKRLLGRLNGTYMVTMSLRHVMDSPTIVYDGTDIEAAVVAYNDLG